MKSQAHSGPKTASVNIKMPTTAAVVVWDPIVIIINPKPIWKVPAKNPKNRSWGEIDNLPATKYPIKAAKIPAINCDGTISTFGYFRTITINTANEIGMINATILPKNWSLDWTDKELPIIRSTPDIPKTIEIKVIKPILSFKKIYPNNAKKIVSVEIIKSVLATVVWYMANTYAEKPMPKNTPAIIPGNPELWKDLKKFFLNLINKYRATIIEKKICLQKRICHKLAPSNDFTIIPPKLKQTAPKITKIDPGIFFNKVNKIIKSIMNIEI